MASQVALQVKSPPDNAGDTGLAGLIPGWARCPGERHGNPLQYSCLENPMEREAWWATVHRVAQSPTQLKRLSRQARCVLLSVTTLSHTPRPHKQVQGLAFRGLGKFAEQTTEAVLKLFHLLKGSSPVLQKEWSSEELWACYKCEPRGPIRSLESESLWVRPREIL